MKIQCACGAKYSFDVTPEMLQTPVRFVCQNCGLDSSELVNELVRQEFNQAPPAGPAPAPATAPAPVAATSPPPALRVTPRASATSETETAAADAPQLCPKHPGQTATHRCYICQKPICPKCMELFGNVCSPLCKGKAESRGIEVPVYAGQKSVVQARQWRRVSGVAAAVCAVLAAVAGTWVWYAWFGSHPKVVFSVRFSDPQYSGESRLCGTNQIVFLHGGLLARHDIKAKKQIWSGDLLDRKQIAADAAQTLQAMQAARTRAIAAGEAVYTFPSPEKVAKETEAAAAAALQLYVRGQNIWVASSDKLVRYDWDTGRPAQELPFARVFGGVILRGDELLLVQETGPGQAAVAHISLATGQSRTEPIGGSATAALASAARAPGPAGDTKSAGLPIGMPGASGGRPLDPAKTAEQAQRLPLPTKIALPAVLAANQNQERALAEMADQPRRQTQPAARQPQPAESFSLVPAKDGFVQFSTRLLESRIVQRQAMKEPPKKSVLDGNLTTANTDAAANEILNDMQRSRGGDTVEEDESRYRVTVRLPGAKDDADWSGEVVGPPALYPLATVNVVAAGKTIIVLDKTNKKLWEKPLSFSVPPRAGSLDEENAPLGLGPCVERGSALYLFDQGVLTAFDLATGDARWRLPSVGVTGLFFDGQGIMYVNTTTASPESIKYSRQIDVTQKTGPVVFKINPKTGKTLWTAAGGLVSYVSGKFIYTLESYRADDEEDTSPYATGLETPSHVRIRRLNPKTGREMWEHYQGRAPLDVQFDRNSIQIVFKKEVQVLKFLSF
jgi:hypothetical protein